MKTKIIIKNYATAEPIIIDFPKMVTNNIVRSSQIPILKCCIGESYIVTGVIRRRLRKKIGLGRYEDIKQILICEVV